MPLTLLSLPEDVLSRILQLVPLQLLTTALRALRLTGSAAHEFLSASESTWRALLPLVGGDKAASNSSRRSGRLVMSAEVAFAREWRALIARGESLHLAVAVAGQDSNISVAKLKQAFSRWGPWPLINRASPVYNATILMECVRARKVAESTLIAISAHVIFAAGADPSARPPPDRAFTCSPLIIAACRGSLKLTAFLLALGADVSPQGEGRFRLCGRQGSLRGCHDAVEWTRRLLIAEKEAGVSEEDRAGLELCHKMLLNVDPALQRERAKRTRELQKGADVPTCMREMKEVASTVIGAARRAHPGRLDDLYEAVKQR